MDHLSTAGVQRRSPYRAVAALALAAILFVVDTLVPFGFAVAVLYVVVVLVAGGFGARSITLWTAAGCVGLTVLSYLLAHGDTVFDVALARVIVSLAAIGITTLLTLQNQAVEGALQERARLLDLAQDAIFVRDMSGAVTYWNRGAARLYGWEPAEVVGKIAPQLLHTQFPEPLEQIRQRLLDDGQWDGEIINTRRDGTQVTVAARWSLLRNGRGLPLAVLETNNDITESRRAEDRIRSAELELRLAINTIPAMIWRMDAAGAVDYTNRRWADYVGAEALATLGGNWQAAVVPEDRARVAESVAALLAGGETGEFEARLRRVDGAVRWFLLSAAPLHQDGQVVSWYATAIDIEQRRTAEDALRRTQAQLIDAQTMSQMGSFSFAIGCSDSVWSDEAARIGGFASGAGLTTEMALARTHPDDLARVMACFAEAARGEADIDHVNRLLLPDGTIKYVHVFGRRILDETGQAEVVGAIQDVTAAKRAEQALDEMRAELAHVTRVATLGELTASIAHEVNQPLAGIVTNGQAGLRWLGRATPDLEEVRAAVTRMISDAQRASDVVRRLRDLAKKATPQTAALDINEMIGDAVAVVQRELLNHRVALHLDLAPEVPAVAGDRIQLQQVIINLMVNGMQAMEARSDRPRQLVLQSRLDGGTDVEITVTDTGSGIAPEDMARLFNPFFTTKSQGMGMGLSICRSIVEAHGGRVWASTPAGAGACFHVALPVPGAQA